MAEQPPLQLVSFNRAFDEELSCGVCLDQYTNPKTLPCHHSFCLKCIEKLPVEIKVISGGIIIMCEYSVSSQMYLSYILMYKC